MKHYKKVIKDDILIITEGPKGYSIASKVEPKQDFYLYPPTYHREPGWKEISTDETSQILGYDVGAELS